MIINELSNQFGNQCIVVAIDAKELADEWTVYLSGGRVPTDKKLLDWAKEAENRGAGEILFTSMNHDGTKQGFANDALRMLSENLSIPIIASGGAGKKEHFYDTFTKGKADAALAASMFHFQEIPIVDLKEYLKEKGVAVRL